MPTKLTAAALALLLMVSSAEARPSLRDWHPSLPNPISRIAGWNFITGYFMGLPWCGATATMLATVVLNRELKPREAFSIMGSCLLPIIGGMIVNHFWNPKWDKLYTKENNVRRPDTD
jgi:hypothetical protein